MQSNATVKMTNSRYKGCSLQFKIWWILFIKYIASVVPQFLPNPLSLDSCVSYHCLICSEMILMISFHTIDPMLSPLYLLGSNFYPFPFQRVLSLEIPQMARTPRFVQRFFAILWIKFYMNKILWIKSMKGWYLIQFSITL